MRILSFILITSFILSSCGEKNKVNDFGIGKHLPNSIINNQLLFSSFEEEYSFPIWFNDSLIRENQIVKITRKIYPLGQQIDISDSIFFLPVKTVSYMFDKNGRVSALEVILTRDNQEISKVHLKYGSLDDKIGYAPYKIVKNEGFHSKNEKISDLPSYDVQKVTDKYIQLVLKKSKENLFVINDDNGWGAFRITKKLHPAANDKLVLGTMYHPLKSYSVENTIKESNVQIFEYQKDLISEITTIDYPFQSKRSFQYDRRGYCTSFVDSMFSDEEFLSRTISKFTNNMHFSPTKIVHEKANMKGESSFHYLELFEYEYRN